MRVLGSAASAAIFAAVGAPRLLKAQSLRAPTARAMSTAQPKVTQDGERRGLTTIAPGEDGTPHTATFIGPIHGLGDTNMGWAQQAMMLHQQLPWVKFVLPNAPTSPVTLNGGMAMPSWYDITDLTDRAGQECTGIDESRAEIIELIEEAKAEGIPASRIVVGGFSQGGAIALNAAYRHDKKLGACVALSGWLTLKEDFAGDLGAAKGTPLFWGHGVHDDKVLFPHQKIGVDLLTQRGVAVDASQYAMGHGAHPDEMAKLAKFVGDVLFPES